MSFYPTVKVKAHLRCDDLGMEDSPKKGQEQKSVSYYRYFMDTQGVHNQGPPLRLNPKMRQIPEDGALSPRAPSEISLHSAVTHNTVGTFASSKRSVGSNSSFAVLMHRAASSGPAPLPAIPQLTAQEIAQIKTIHSRPTTEAVLECVVENEKMLVEVVHSCAKIHKKIKPPQSLHRHRGFQALLDQLDQVLDELSGRQLATVAWSLAITRSNRLWR